MLVMQTTFQRKQYVLSCNQLAKLCGENFTVQCAGFFQRFHKQQSRRFERKMIQPQNITQTFQLEIYFIYKYTVCT